MTIRRYLTDALRRLRAGDSPRVRSIAVDWSGDKSAARKKIWLGEALEGDLVRLECGRSGAELADHLVDLANTNSQLIAGFDFGFSLPAWFLADLGCETAPAMWQRSVSEAEQWIRVNPPFWGGMYGKRPVYTERQNPYRVSDLTINIGGISPKSVFQVGGGGSVGTGSARGWPILHTLREAGFSIWPFDPPRLPMVVEIYPRVLTSAVNKSSAIERAAHLKRNYPGLTTPMASKAAANDDAFDAAVSALVMDRYVDQLLNLPVINDPRTLLEGVIWHPALDLASSARPSGVQP